MSESQPFIFISYSRADKEFVTRLITDLQAQGINIWIDKEAIQPGTAEWDDALRTAIRACQAAVLIVSPNARSSRYIKGELRVAEMYQHPIYPVWAAGTEWVDTIPLIDLSGTEYIDARETKYAQALPQLVAVLKAVAVAHSQDSAQASTPEPAFEPRNPYKGLHAFTANDTGDFFGRERLVEQLVKDVAGVVTDRPTNTNGRLLTIIGPSGSGKSSVVMAGLLPRLQHEALPSSKAWVYLEPMVPGKHPIEALGLTLAAHFPDRSFTSIREDLQDDATRGLHVLATQLLKQQGNRVVLLVDQFEELFTQTESEDERRLFIDLLLTATTEAQGPLLVLLTMRADFYDRLMQYPELYRLVEAHHIPVLPIEIEDLRATIEKPAALPDVQLSFEGNLVGDLLFEVQGQPGALPLLQFTLEQLFERRSDHHLTLSAYHEIGGVKGALAKQAESTYAALPSDEHRRLARALFLRLIDPGLTEQDTTRRRAALSEFSLADASTTRLLRETADAFIAARLLTANEVAGTTTLEVSHEAVIREWKRLVSWMLEARQDIPLQQAITKDVTEWQQRGKPKDRLYRSSQLKEAQAWARRNAASGNEVAFLQASATGRMRSRIGILAIVLLVLLLAIPAGVLVRSSLLANVVTSLSDDGPGSLRQVIAAAKLGDTIMFDRSLWGQTIMMTNDLVITKQNLTIRGPGARLLTISSSTHQIAVRSGASISISNLAFIGGKSNSTALLKNEGMLTLTNSTVSGNTASVLHGSTLGGGIFNNGTLILTNSTISGNTPSGSGGGIFNNGTLILTNSTVSGNTAASGGGIFNNGTLILTNSTVSGNTASDSGGGIFNSSDSTLTLTNSTISGNSTSQDGGGIHDSGTLTLTNSTISGNSASHSGGGIFQSSIDSNNPRLIAKADLNFCTIYSNTAPIGGDIAVQDITSNGGDQPLSRQASQMKIRNSIVAGTSAHPSPDIAGMLTSDGYDLLQDNSGATFDPATSEQHGTDRMLSVNELSKLFAAPLDLRDNGGPTRTYALAPGSSALDQVPVAACHGNDISTDQRGVKRPQGKGCDIGAFELVP